MAVVHSGPLPSAARPVVSVIVPVKYNWLSFPLFLSITHTHIHTPSSSSSLSLYHTHTHTHIHTPSSSSSLSLSLSLSLSHTHVCTTYHIYTQIWNHPDIYYEQAMSNESSVPSPSSWLADEGFPRPPPGDNHCHIDWVGVHMFTECSNACTKQKFTHVACFSH